MSTTFISHVNSSKYDSWRLLIEAPHLAQGDDTSPKLQVEWLRQHKPANQVALLFHPNPVDGGTMDNKVVDTLWRYCRDRGMDVVRYNSRGVGASSGVATAGEGEFLDAVCVLNWLSEQTDIRTLWLGGFSFGGFLACRLAAYIDVCMPKWTVERLALIAPSVERHDTSQLRLPMHKSFIIYGDNDTLVSPSVMAEFAQAHAMPSKVLAGVGHFFHGQLPALKQAILFLDEALQ
ncbi:MAG: alpha/beta fold hydrolase [Moraxella sp.]|nr:alpha/beta fold hydrolase [Moraxella sp.]